MGRKRMSWILLLIAIDLIGGSHFSRSWRCVCRGGMLVATASMASVRGLSKLRTIFHYLEVPVWNVLPNGKSASFLDIEAMNNRNPDWYQQDMRLLLRFLSEGHIDPYVDQVLPLSQAAQAHRLLLDRQVKGKLVLVPDP